MKYEYVSPASSRASRGSRTDDRRTRLLLLRTCLPCLSKLPRCPLSPLSWRKIWHKSIAFGSTTPHTSNLQKSTHLQKSRPIERHKPQKRRVDPSACKKGPLRGPFLEGVRGLFFGFVPLNWSTFLQIGRLLQITSTYHFLHATPRHVVSCLFVDQAGTARW